ncbi:MAG: zinc-ribbon domain-containing protein [Thermodesulfobacteriota bacterium]
MDITCSSCGTLLHVPDQKLPPNQVVHITCPKCKKKIKVDTREPNFEPASAKKGGQSHKEEQWSEYDQDTSPLEFFEEGVKLALVLDTDELHLSKINPALEELGYKTIQPFTLQEAMAKIRLHPFDMVILSEGFDEKGLDGNPITNYLNRLSMSVRRQIYLVLISNRFKTMDNMTAFAMSANLVIHPDDLANLRLIVKKGTSENEKFYKVFMDTLKEIGKD